MAGKKPAKLAHTQNSTQSVEFTKRMCAHCGNPIPTDKVLVVKRIWYEGFRQRKRLVYYIKGHETQ